MTFYDLPAPAKLNLFLHVVGRREDGYHLLQSLFRLISLSDSITIDLRRDGRISRESTLTEQIADESDLVVRAARAIQRATGCVLGAHIHVNKRIPSGAGLGGGSSDAATVLLALNRMWRTGLNRQQLMAIGLTLGADVPFFLQGTAAFVQGIGEQIESVNVPDISYLVFKPDVHIETAAVFTDPDLTRDSETVKITDFSGCINFVGSGNTVQNRLSDGVIMRNKTIWSGSGFGKNDLEAVVLRRFAAVHRVKSWLSTLGVEARLSGSGSCLFAEADTPESAQLASEELLAKMQSGNEISNFKLGGSLKSVHVCDGLQFHPLKDWVSDSLGSRQVG
ncbi:4-(cytidine 5'-diphospho)-2-C-methyl-D-erythritol kinase [Orrella marina]|uniref:4-diphosphocytidyl-2-C-methyl-D-erythritol kinase n=1 Tax=Orrella marina TaxID=2163011 RepID=A0A2R4XKL6_9BURK|nr:4-(cytidine 5'-diphospho)-2-C-methyl-D-erythritol kinase [Orrella marina]AWB34347.1 4-(cytidine 5'-diphospho)-2-C-methyl-D-erythritol kinase [Orrella marina]